MNSYNHTIARVRAYARSQGIKPARLAIMAGLHANTLRKFDKQEWSPSGATLAKLEAIVPADFVEAEAA